MHQEEVIDNFKQIVANVNSRKPEGRDAAVGDAVRRGGRLDWKGSYLMSLVAGLGMFVVVILFVLLVLADNKKADK